MTFKSLIVWLLLCSWKPGEVTGLQCYQCAGDYAGMKCEEPCEGELCVVWKWKTKSEVVLRQGCLSGLDKRYTAKIGCRTNHLMASLCICNEDNMCNSVERADQVIPAPVVMLPSVQCISKVTGTDILGSQRESHKCDANYCHMTRKETFHDEKPPDVMNVYNCADVAEYDFDVRLKNTVNFPGLYANGCYKIQTHQNEAQTDCTCSKNLCNSGLPFVNSVAVRCHLANDVTKDNHNVKNSFCDGDYCFIQRQDGRYTKGCLTVNERNSWSHIHTGHRHIVGVDQWLCQSHLCNFDLHRLNRSLAPLHSKYLQRTRFSLVPSLSLLLLTAQFVYLLV